MRELRGFAPGSPWRNLQVGWWPWLMNGRERKIDFPTRSKEEIRMVFKFSIKVKWLEKEVTERSFDKSERDVWEEKQK